MNFYRNSWITRCWKYLISYVSVCAVTKEDLLAWSTYKGSVRPPYQTSFQLSNKLPVSCSFPPMRLTNFFTIVSVAVTGILATPLALNTTLDIDLSVNTHYGAPLPPWAAGHEPGWYLGSQCSLYPDLLCLEGVRSNVSASWLHSLTRFMLKVVCEILSLLLPSDWLHCPSQPSPYPSPTGDGYTHVFSNLTGATEAGDYLTYGLVDTVAGMLYVYPAFLIEFMGLDCKAMCNSIKGCAFVNSECPLFKHLWWCFIRCFQLTMTSMARSIVSCAAQ